MRASFVRKGEPFKINLSQASTNDHVDGELARANAIAVRTPYQSQSDARKLCNKGGTNYFDTHLSLREPGLRYGFYGDLDVAVIEATEMVPQRRSLSSAQASARPRPSP